MWWLPSARPWTGLDHQPILRKSARVLMQDTARRSARADTGRARAEALDLLVHHAQQAHPRSVLAWQG